MLESYDVSHKLAYAGQRSPVPFVTGPEYTNSVPGVPVLAMLRIFLEPKNWSEENVKTVAREVCRVLGATIRFDIGITLTTTFYDPNRAASAATARLIKMQEDDASVALRISDEMGDRVFVARFPRLAWELSGEDFWQSAYAPGAVKVSSQQ